MSICQFQADVFDGHRLARLALVDAQANGDRVTCHGYYRRIEGYSSSRQGQERAAHRPLHPPWRHD
jgi:hypothetical protein